MKKHKYSPYINHFIQPDTIIPNPADPQSWNRYSYVQNNPIRYTDPTGHFQIEDPGNNTCTYIACQPSYTPPTPKPKSQGTSSGGGNSCNGPNPSVVCLDPALIGDFEVHTDFDYAETPITVSPDNKLLAENTASRGMNALLLLHDMFGWFQGSDYVARSITKERVWGSVDYQLYKGEISNYAVVTSVTVFNETNSTIVVTNISSSNKYQFPLIARPVIGKNEDRDILLPAHVSTSITINMYSLVNQNTTLTFQISVKIPWSLP